MHKMWKSRPFSKLLLQERDHWTQKEVKVSEWHSRVIMRTLHIWKIEENECFVIFSLFHEHGCFPHVFLFQMIKVLLNSHTKETTGIFKALGRLTRLWTHIFLPERYLLFSADAYIYRVSRVVRISHLIHPSPVHIFCQLRNFHQSPNLWDYVPKV